MFLKKKMWAVLLACSLATSATAARAGTIEQGLSGLDTYVNNTIKAWNVAGAGVGVVYKNRLIYAKGFGYRDFEHKLPVTSKTCFQIASNTKLFTAMAVGMLVDQKKLEWDKPVKLYVPSIQFYNDQLDNTVTIRDMLSHRTGISRHDMIWYKSDYTRDDLFGKLKYLERIPDYFVKLRELDKGKVPKQPPSMRKWWHVMNAGSDFHMAFASEPY